MIYECQYPEPQGAKCKGHCCLSCDHALVCDAKCTFINFKKIEKPGCGYAYEVRNDLKSNKYENQIKRYEKLLYLEVNK